MREAGNGAASSAIDGARPATPAGGPAAPDFSPAQAHGPAAAHVSSGAAPTGTAGAGGARPSALRRAAPAAILLIGAVAALVLGARHLGAGRGDAGSRRAMLAVLPFRDLGPESAESWFADGLTEETISRLGRLSPERLGLIARATAMRYRGAGGEPGETGAALGVDYVLQGSIRRDPRRIRLTAHLIRVVDREVLWTETFDRGAADLLDVQSDLAARIARSLALELLHGAGGGETPIDDAAAWDAYLRGRYLMSRSTREDTQRALPYLEEAARRAPGFAEAHAALAVVVRDLTALGSIPWEEGTRRARAEADRALALDPGSAEAMTALGWLAIYESWDWPAAEDLHRRALQANPNWAPAHHALGWYLLTQERYDEAFEAMRAARTLDPLSPAVNSDLGWFFYRARRYEEAAQQCRRTLELDPGFLGAVWCLKDAYGRLGRWDEMRAYMRRQMADAGAAEAEIAAVTGLPPEEARRGWWRWDLERIERAPRSGPRGPFGRAVHLAAMGERDAALDALETALAGRDPGLVFIRITPELDVLRGDPRFERIVRGMRFPPA